MRSAAFVLTVLVALGAGAVREALEAILKAQTRWPR